MQNFSLGGQKKFFNAGYNGNSVSGNTSPLGISISIFVLPDNVFSRDSSLVLLVSVYNETILFQQAHY